MAKKRNSRIITPGSNSGVSTRGDSTPTSRTGSIINDGSSWSQGNSSTSSYWDLIKNFNGSQDELIELLKSLGINWNKEMTSSQDEDWNKQLLDNMLQQLITRDNRQYNEYIWNRDNLYNNPTNVMLRLMATGMSRDAALQMLSGGGSGGASGATADPSGALATGLPASESALNGLNAKLGIANTAISGISAVTGLVGLGFSIPQALQQAKMLKYQNVLFKGQAQAFQAAQTASQIMYAAGSAADSFANVANASAEIKKLAENGDTSAQQFIQSGGLQQLQHNAPYASKFLADTALTDRSYSDHAKRFKIENDFTEAQTSLSEATTANFVQQTQNLIAEHEQILAQTEFIDAQRALAIATGNKTREETRGLKFANDLTENTLNATYDGESGIDILSTSRLLEAKSIIKRFTAADSFDLWQLEAEELAGNYQMLTSMHALSKLYVDGAQGEFQKDPDFYNMMYAFQMSGGMTFLGHLIQMGQESSSFGFKLGPVNINASSSGTDFLTKIGVHGMTNGEAYKKWFKDTFGNPTKK